MAPPGDTTGGGAMGLSPLRVSRVNSATHPRSPVRPINGHQQSSPVDPFGAKGLHFVLA